MNLSSYIENIRKADDKIHTVIETSFGDFVTDIKKSKFPFTGKAIIMLVTKSNFIKNSIFDIALNEDLYSANILFRSLIEHFLRHQYLFISFAKDKEDTVGIDYYKYCDMGENFDFLRAIKSTKQIFDPDNVDINTWEILSNISPEFKKLSPKELEDKNRRFTYKNIVKYIVSTIPHTGNDTLLKSIIPTYSELSSFVHGGPGGEDVLLKNQKKDVRSESLKNICRTSFLITKNIKLFTYFFGMQLFPKYLSFYKQISEINLNF